MCKQTSNPTLHHLRPLLVPSWSHRQANYWQGLAKALYLAHLEILVIDKFPSKGLFEKT